MRWWGMCALAGALGLSTQALAACPVGPGSICITSIGQLDQIGTNPSMPLSGDYVLGQNIDASGFSFSPVGSNSSPFTGMLDGASFELSGLTINSGSTSAGLFGDIGSSGTVENMSMSNATLNIKNGSDGGLLAGDNSGTISNVNVEGTLTVTSGGLGLSDVGGIVGDNMGVITNSSSASTLETNIYTNAAGGLVGTNLDVIAHSSASGTVGSAAEAGGLVGQNYGPITSSSATSGVSTTSGDGGGLVGFNGGGGIISTSFSTGGVSGVGGVAVGGLVGENGGSIDQSYTISSVAATSGGGFFAGGFAGANGGDIADSYSKGSVSAQQSDRCTFDCFFSSYAGGFAGTNDDAGLSGKIEGSYTASPEIGTPEVTMGGFVPTSSPFIIGSAFGVITNSYWDTNATGQSASGGGTPEPTSFFTSGNLPAGFDPTVWRPTAGQYPTLIANPPPQKQPLSLTLTSPDTIAAAQMNGAIYSASLTGGLPSNIQLFSDSSGANGFQAAAYHLCSGPCTQTNIVTDFVVFRGTDISPTTIGAGAGANLLADADLYAKDANSQIVQSYLSEAQGFLTGVQQYEKAQGHPLALTGDSMGGGIAQLLGADTGLPTVTFNALGASNIASQAGVLTNNVGNILNIRTNGDIVSPLQPQIGETITIQTSNALQLDLQSIKPASVISGEFANHSDMTNFANLLQQGPILLLKQPSLNTPPSSVLGCTCLVADALATGTDLAASVVAPTVVKAQQVGATLQNIGDYVISGISTDTAYVFSMPWDPLTYEFLSNSGSPDLESLTVPFVNDVSLFDISIEIGSTWSPNYTLDPGNTFLFGAGVDGFLLTPLDELGQNVAIDDPLFIGVTFTSGGDFSGAVIATESVPEPSALNLLATGLLALGMLSRLRRVPHRKRA